MPRIVKTSTIAAAAMLRGADRGALEYALEAITASALDDADSGADTCAVVYEQLAKLGVVVP